MLQHELHDTIKACITNNSLAQERLYKHYFALMYSFCKRYSEDRQTIIGLINEGFLKVFLNLNNFDESKGNFEGWIKRIMINTCIDHVRAAKNNNLTIPAEEDGNMEAGLTQLPKNYVEEEVLFLMKKLPPVTQKVFSLHVFKGYSHKEIAHIMDMAESTSRWHVLEARKNLKPQVQKIL